LDVSERQLALETQHILQVSAPVHAFITRHESTRSNNFTTPAITDKPVSRYRKQKASCTEIVPAAVGASATIK
jgi:hypothetical protein